MSKPPEIKYKDTPLHRRHPDHVQLVPFQARVDYIKISNSRSQCR